MVIEGVTLWTAVGAISPIIIALIGGFAYIRKNDLMEIDQKFSDLKENFIDRMATNERAVAEKLDEAEFRRFEEKYDRNTENLEKRTDQRIDKLEEKMDIGFEKFMMKFDKIFELLSSK